MITRAARRLLHALLVLVGVNVVTFALFFLVSSPDQMARTRLGPEASTAQIEAWKRERSYHLPYFYNRAPALGPVERVSQTVFFQRSIRYFWLDFGRADDGSPITQSLLARVPPSLAITLPVLVLGLWAEISAGMILAYFRGTAWDLRGGVGCVLLMSTSAMFHVIAGQWLFSHVLRWVPISGFEGGPGAARFVVLPIVIGTALGFGPGARWYRALFLDEMGKSYVRTARANGLPERRVLFRHVLANALVPIVTTVAGAIPFLFTGSLVLESFFAIPGMGMFLLEALRRQDFAAVQAMVFLGSTLQVAALALTDLAYARVDPRMRPGA